MFRAQFVGFAWRMERVAEADQPIGTALASNKAGHAATHGFTADHKGSISRRRLDDASPGIEQNGLPVRRPLAAASAPASHIGEFKTQDPEPRRGNAFGDLVHEGRVHRRTGAVGQNERGRRTRRPIHEKIGRCHARLIVRCWRRSHCPCRR